jgi:hypothetical protein
MHIPGIKKRKASVASAGDNEQELVHTATKEEKKEIKREKKRAKKRGKERRLSAPEEEGEAAHTHTRPESSSPTLFRSPTPSSTMSSSHCADSVAESYVIPIYIPTFTHFILTTSPDLPSNLQPNSAKPKPHPLSQHRVAARASRILYTALRRHGIKLDRISSVSTGPLCRWSRRREPRPIMRGMVSR